MLIQSKIIKDLFKYLPQAIIPAFIGFISVPIYTRFFLPSSYGNFAIAKVTIEVLKRGSSWFGASLTRYYHDHEKDGNLSLMLTVIIKANLVISFFVIISFVIIINIIEIKIELLHLLSLGVAIFAFSLIRQTLTNVLRMQRRINTISVFMLITSLGSFLLSIIFITIFNFGIESIFISEIIVIIIILPFLWRFSIKRYFSYRANIDFRMIIKFLNYGMPLIVANLGIWILNMSDRYMLGIILGSEEVGIYSACYNVTWNSLFLIVNLFFMMEEPLAMKIWANDGEDALKEFINRETRIFLLTIIPIAIWIYAYSDVIFGIMVSSEYAYGIIVVPYVSLSVVISGIIYKFRLVFLVKEKTKKLMNIVLFSAFINVIGNFLLIPSYGILGASISTLIAYSIYLLLIVISANKIFKWTFPLVPAVRIVIAGILSLVPLYFSSTTAINYQSALGYIFISGVTYLCALTIFGEITRAQYCQIFEKFKGRQW
jgi:O-antigen/teichoic acid export membrane protein